MSTLIPLPIFGVETFHAGLFQEMLVRADFTNDSYQTRQLCTKQVCILLPLSKNFELEGRQTVSMAK